MLALLAVFAAMVVLAARSLRAGLLAIVFLTPWNGFDVDFGLRVSAYQVTVAAVLAVAFVRSLQPGWHVQRPAAGRLLAVFVTFAVCWSLLQLAFIPRIEIASGFTRQPEVRAPIQIALYVFSIMPALLIGWTMRGSDDLRAMLRTYLGSVALLGLIGWVQLAVWYATGTNPLPVGVVNDWLGGSAQTRVGSFDFGALAIYRMNSLAGEPRQLGTALVFAMLLIQSVMLTARLVDWRRLAPLWGFFLITAAATYSTSAVATWLIGTAVQLTLPWLLGVPIRRSLGQLATGVLIALTPIVLAIGVAQLRGLPVLDLIADRTIDRIDANGAVEDFDLAIIDWLKARPADIVLGAGLGNAHLYAGPYLQPEFRWYAEGSVFTAKQQYLRLVSELGLVGLVLFLGWYAVLAIDVARLARRNGGEALAPLVSIGLVTLLVFLATGSVIGEFWAVAGALAAAAGAMQRARAPAGRLALA